MIKKKLVSNLSNRKIKYQTKEMSKVWGKAVPWWHHCMAKGQPKLSWYIIIVMYKSKTKDEKKKRTLTELGDDKITLYFSPLEVIW